MPFNYVTINVILQLFINERLAESMDFLIARP